MKVLTLFIVVLLAWLFLPVSGFPDLMRFGQPAKNSLAIESFNEINRLRVEAELPALAWSGELYQLALENNHRMNVIGQLRHAYSRVETIGEYSEWEFLNGKQLAHRWEASPFHLKALLTPGISEGAVAISEGYYTFEGK